MISREDALKMAEKVTNLEEMKSVLNQIFDSIVPEDASKKDPWVWVKTEYCAMFKAKNPDKGGKVREATARMKKMFSAFPEMRKEDVIGTVKLYLSQTNSKYIRYPHYFLVKGSGATAVYEFEDWHEKYQESKNAGTGRTSNTNTMQ